jgi:lipopolysaccharide export system permease protein
MMRTLDRYVAREFLRLYLIFITCAPLLFIIGDWTDNVGKYAEQGIPVGRVALSYFYQLPLFISWSMPVAALIATVFTVSNMARHSELTAAKAGGLSFYRVLAVLPILGILLTGLGLVVTELVPITTVKNREALGRTETLHDQSKHDFVVTGREGHVYTIRRMSIATRTLGGITVEHNSNRGEAPLMHVSAREARWDSIAGGWTLFDGFYRSFEGEGGEERAFRFASMQLASFRETPEQLMAREKEPEEMRYAELGRFIETLERSGGRPLKMMVERHQKIAIPMATFIIILFGAPLANSSARGGAAYGIGISLGITVAYMMLFRFTGSAGNAGLMDPLHAAWIPNIVVLGAALLLLSRVRT